MLDSLPENTESVSADFGTSPGCSITDISEKSESACGLFVEIFVDGILSIENNIPGKTSKSVDGFVTSYYRTVRLALGS